MTLAQIINDYAPYDRVPEFDLGFKDYQIANFTRFGLKGVAQQAYDRGMDAAARWEHEQWMNR